MVILFVAPRFHTNQYQMVKTLQEEGHEVVFHVASHGSTEDHSLLTPIVTRQSRCSVLIERIIGNGRISKPYYFPSPVKYWKVFKKCSPDVVIIRDPYKFFSLLVACYSLFVGARIIFYTQEGLFRHRSFITKVKQTLTLKVFRAAWMTPKMEWQSYRNEKLKLEHMYYVPLPISFNYEDYNKEELSDTNVLKLLMIGKYHQERKRHYLFLKALSMLKCKYKLSATIVGECIRESQLKKFQLLNDKVYEMGLTDTVELRKNVPFQEMKALYASHHVFVLPAINEPYSVSVVEALGNGLPSICTDSCGSKFNIIDGVNGFVIKSDSLEELVNALEKLLGNKELLIKMRENSLRYVAENLSGKAFYKCFQHLLNTRFQKPLKPNYN